MSMGQTTVSIPYGKSKIPFTINSDQCVTVLRPNGQTEAKQRDETDIVEEALANPIESPRLCDLAQSCQRILVITSDHTRPLPSRITLPLLLAEMRLKNPTVDVQIIVATGYHRQTRKEELIEKFGQSLIDREEFVIHDCQDASQMVYKGQLPSGGELWLNNRVDQADLIVAEGFIEPHFFAGFSGGRKSILPGIAGAESILANHCAAFIDHPAARTGVLQDNPMHLDMVDAARKASLSFILNVMLDDDKKITGAFAGHPEAAHASGCRAVAHLAGVKKQEADIVITSNGGYPLDQNLYQAVKGMTAAETCVRPGGVIIMVAACEDGLGGDAFCHWLTEASTPAAALHKILAIPRDQTNADQWQAQILARVLQRSAVIVVSDCCDERSITAMHMKHAATLEQAWAQAKTIVGDSARTLIIPDGVSVIVQD
jgi:nickel-dependent lactate racemase